MKSVLFFLLILVLCLAGFFLWRQPEHLISPGHLLAGHTELEADCAACHQPFRGVPAANCRSCHAPAEIDSLAESTGRPRFHEHLLEDECVACHREHRGPQAPISGQRFAHALLQPPQRQECALCHRAPVGPPHEAAGVSCGTCHTESDWFAVAFDHASLAAKDDPACAACHTPPADELHADTGSDCAACHETRRWSPASYDHDEYFVFDRHHPPRCLSCHEEGRWSTYSCFGCHEHTQAKIRSEHLEEGIRDWQDCASCHRSGDEHDIRRSGVRGEREGRTTKEGRERREHDDD